MGIAVPLLMMLRLGWEYWARLIIWLAAGVFAYLSYAPQARQSAARERRRTHRVTTKTPVRLQVPPNIGGNGHCCPKSPLIFPGTAKSAELKIDFMPWLAAPFRRASLACHVG